MWQLGGHGRAQHRRECGWCCGDPRNCGTIDEPSVPRNICAWRGCVGRRGRDLVLGRNRASRAAIVRGADMRELQPTVAPVRGFLDWPVATDPSEWFAEVALIGIQHSEPYAHDPHPNDQASAPDAIRLRSEQISYGRDQWDFDLDTPLAALLPRCIDMGNVAWRGGSYDDYSAAISDRARHLWKEGAQIFALGGDHGVTIPLLDALDAVGETVHVFHVDAHLDWRKEVGGVPRGYSSPLRWAS